MDNDLLKNTLKQVIDLIHHNFLSQAEEIAEQALKVFDDRNLWQLLAICKIGMKKYKEAESILRKSLENHPNPSDFNNLRSFRMRKIIHRIIKQKPSLLGEHIQHLLLAEPI
jgi:tetratricopeptide (TPR) repeat protein